MKKLLFLIDSDNIGGVEKRYSHLYKYLAQNTNNKNEIVFLINRKLTNKIN